MKCTRTEAMPSTSDTFGEMPVVSILPWYTLSDVGFKTFLNGIPMRATIFDALEDAIAYCRSLGYSEYRYPHGRSTDVDWLSKSGSWDRSSFRERKIQRTDMFWQFTYGWKLRKCSACNGTGCYDHNGSPPCGACDGSAVERYRGPKSRALGSGSSGKS